MCRFNGRFFFINYITIRKYSKTIIFLYLIELDSMKTSNDRIFLRANSPDFTLFLGFHCLHVYNFLTKIHTRK